MLEVIQRSADFLARREIEAPRLQAELMLAHVLDMPRLNLYLNFNRLLGEAELSVVRDYVKRRAGHEPLQHILGYASFCGVDFTVKPTVLVPRPETEILAEHAWQCLLSPNGYTPGGPAVLDLGTGSGCLAIILALRCPTARIVAMDVSPDALAVAQLNARTHGVAARVYFCAGDRLNPLASPLELDLLVTNPPYIPTSQIAALQPEVRDFEPRVALDGGADGLEFFRYLARTAGPYLRVGGRLMAEFGDLQEVAVQELFSHHGWRIEKIAPDNAGKPRILVAGRQGFD